MDNGGLTSLFHGYDHQAIGKYMQLKTLTSQVNYKTMSASKTMNVLTDEINQSMANSIFAIQ